MYQLIQATNYYRGRMRQARLVVLHDMEAAQGNNTAENVARWMAGPKRRAPKASVHLLVDRNSVCQGVRLADTAWGAKGANADAVHIEHAGYARFTRRQWLDEDMMLNLSAAAAAELVNALWIPPVLLTVAQVADRESRGFATHADVSRAFHVAGGHTDPEPNFPVDIYLDKVRWFVPHAKTLHALR